MVAISGVVQKKLGSCSPDPNLFWLKFAIDFPSLYLIFQLFPYDNE